MVPDLVQIGPAPRQEGGDAARQRVALAAAALGAALRVAGQRGRAVGDVVGRALLHDQDAAEGAGQARGALALGQRGDLVGDALARAQAGELGRVGRQHALAVALHELRPRLREQQRVGVKHERHVPRARGANDGGARVEHEPVAPEAGPDHEHVQARQQGHDGCREGLGALAGRGECRQPQQRVHHQIGRVGLDGLRRLRLAHDVAHVGPEARAGHGREERRARVVGAAADDGHPAHLPCSR